MKTQDIENEIESEICSGESEQSNSIVFVFEDDQIPVIQVLQDTDSGPESIHTTVQDTSNNTKIGEVENLPFSQEETSLREIGILHTYNLGGYKHDNHELLLQDIPEVTETEVSVMEAEEECAAGIELWKDECNTADQGMNDSNMRNFVKETDIDAAMAELQPRPLLMEGELEETITEDNKFISELRDKCLEAEEKVCSEDLIISKRDEKGVLTTDFNYKELSESACILEGALDISITVSETSCFALADAEVVNIEKEAGEYYASSTTEPPFITNNKPDSLEEINDGARKDFTECMYVNSEIDLSEWNNDARIRKKDVICSFAMQDREVLPVDNSEVDMENEETQVGIYTDFTEPNSKNYYLGNYSNSAVEVEAYDGLNHMHYGSEEKAEEGSDTAVLYLVNEAVTEFGETVASSDGSRVFARGKENKEDENDKPVPEHDETGAEDVVSVAGEVLEASINEHNEVDLKEQGTGYTDIIDEVGPDVTSVKDMLMAQPFEENARSGDECCNRLTYNLDRTEAEHVHDVFVGEQTALAFNEISMPAEEKADIHLGGNVSEYISTKNDKTYDDLFSGETLPEEEHEYIIVQNLNCELESWKENAILEKSDSSRRNSANEKINECCRNVPDESCLEEMMGVTESSNQFCQESPIDKEMITFIVTDHQPEEDTEYGEADIPQICLANRSLMQTETVEQYDKEEEVTPQINVEESLDVAQTPISATDYDRKRACLERVLEDDSQDMLTVENMDTFDSEDKSDQEYLFYEFIPPVSVQDGDTNSSKSATLNDDSSGILKPGDEEMYVAVGGEPSASPAHDENTFASGFEEDLPDYLEDVKDLLVPYARRKKAKKKSFVLEDVLKESAVESHTGEPNEDFPFKLPTKLTEEEEKELEEIAMMDREGYARELQRYLGLPTYLTEEEEREFAEIRAEQESLRAAQRKELEKYLAMPAGLTPQEQKELDELIAEEEREKAIQAESEARLTVLLEAARAREEKEEDEESQLRQYMDLPATLTTEEEQLLTQEDELSPKDFKTEDEYREYLKQRYLLKLEEEKIRVEEEEYEIAGYYYDDDYDDELEDAEYPMDEDYPEVKDKATVTESKPEVSRPKPKKTRKVFSLLKLRSKGSKESASSQESQESQRDSKDKSNPGSQSKKFFHFSGLRIKRKKKSEDSLLEARSEVKRNPDEECTAIECDFTNGERKEEQKAEVMPLAPDISQQKMMCTNSEMDRSSDPTLTARRLNGQIVRGQGNSDDSAKQFVEGGGLVSMYRDRTKCYHEDMVAVQNCPQPFEQHSEKEDLTSLSGTYDDPVSDSRTTGTAGTVSAMGSNVMLDTRGMGTEPCAPRRRGGVLTTTADRIGDPFKRSVTVSSTPGRECGMSDCEEERLADEDVTEEEVPYEEGRVISLAEEEPWPEEADVQAPVDDFEQFQAELQENSNGHVPEEANKKKKRTEGEKKGKKKKKKRDFEKENMKTAYQNRDDVIQKHVGPRVRSFDTTKMKDKFNRPKEQKVSNDCHMCGKQVFQMEKIIAEKASWHKNCFRCTECSKPLTLESYQSHEGRLYCKPHFKSLFQPKAVIVDEAEERRERLLRRPRMIILESQPEALPDDVVRATAKPDYGLDELQHTNIRQKFALFERAEQEEERKLEPISVCRSHSLMSKAAKFLAGSDDHSSYGIENSELGEFGADDEEEEEEADEQEEMVGEDGEVIIKASSRRKKERPMSFSGMGELKAAWEQKHRREEMSQARKEEIAKFRQLLCAGKNLAMKEMFESGNLENHENTNRTRDDIQVEGRRAARNLRERFEKGKPFILEDDDDDSGLNEHYSEEKEQVDEVFKEAETAFKARNLFRQIDSQVSQEGAPMLRSQSFASQRRREHRPFQNTGPLSPSADIVKAEEKLEDFHVETSDLASRFRFFANYEENLKDEKQRTRKVFRMTPPREITEQVAENVKALMPKPCMTINCKVCRLRGLIASEEIELGRDPNLIRSTDNYQDEVDCRNTRNILQMFKKMELGTDDKEEGPRPLKRFTPPPEGEHYGESEEDEDEYTDEDYSDDDDDDDEYEEDDEGNRRPKYKDEILEMSAKKAGQLRAKFEKWEAEVERQNELNRNRDPDEEEYMPSLDTARNLRAMFESKALEEQKPVKKTHVKVNRFV